MEIANLNVSKKPRGYDTFEQISGYESDGRSVSSEDTINARYRIMSPDADDIYGDYDEDDDEDEFNITAQTSGSKELKYILGNSALISLTFLMEYSLTIISLFVIGHVCTSSDDLASASLAVMTYNITGLAFIEGMATSLDTFCSQAFGAQKYTKVGLYMLRCSAMIFSGMIPIIVAWWFSASWLGYLIPEHDILPNIQLFLRTISFGVPGLILFETGKRFLQSQGDFEAGTYALSFTVPVNITLVVLFTKNFGYSGAPVGIALSHWFMAGCLFLYCRYWNRDTLMCWYPLFDSWFHFKRVFTNWKPMWKLAFPGLLMIEAEYLSFEVLTIMSSHFGVKAIAAQSVISNIGSLVYQTPFAMGCVVSTRVANFIGMECVENAKTTIKTSYMIAAMVGIINFLAILMANKPVSHLFTDDPDVVELASSLAPILAVNQLYDSITTFSAAILRGQGRQSIGGLLNIIAYYFIALPISGWLAFGRLHLELRGLWYGCGVGILLLAISLTICVISSNWDQVVKDFLEREANEQEIDLESMASNVSTV